MIGGGMDLYGHFAPAVAQENACPHCHGIGGLNPDVDLYQVCRLCGGPRINYPAGVVPSEATLIHLRAANAARRMRSSGRTMSVAGTIGSLFGLGAFGLGFLAHGLGLAMFMGTFFGAPFAILLLVGLARIRSTGASIKNEIDAAWAGAAADVVRSGRANTPEELAAAFGIDPARAASLHGSTNLGSGANLGASASLGDGASRVRFATSTGLPEDTRLRALEKGAEDAQRAAELREAEAEVESMFEPPRKS